MQVLIILNEPPYGSERSYNGLRLAGPQETELVLKIVIETAKLVVAPAAYLVIFEDEILAWLGDDRAKADLERLMTNETLGDYVLDRLAACRTSGENAPGHATNLSLRGCSIPDFFPRLFQNFSRCFS